MLQGQRSISWQKDLTERGWMALFQYALGYTWVIHANVCNPPLSGCSLLKATRKFSSVSPPEFHSSHITPHILMCMRVRLEGNLIKSNPPKLHGAPWKEHRSTRKGTSYLTPALRMSVLWGKSAKWWRWMEHFTAQQKLYEITVHGGAHLVICLQLFGVFVFLLSTQTGRQSSRRKAASAAVVLIDIPAKEWEYSNVSKLCYLSWESAEIRG